MKKLKSNTAAIIGLLVVVVAMALKLQQQGRTWFATDGTFKLWISDAWGGDNSQHLSDPYSFSHMLHGLVFFGACYLLLPKLSLLWRHTISIFVESIWEVMENTQAVIDRYREGTAALGYTGDTIINCIGDLASCTLGFVLAYYLGWKKSLLLFLITEIIMILTIRDSLMINVIMLIYPIDGIKEWQSVMTGA